MSEDRKKMNQALKTIVLPVLRAKGFNGSFNHFRRINKDSVDLLTFWFSNYGGEFCIDIAKCSEKGVVGVRGNIIPANKVKAWDFNDPRVRLKPNMNELAGDYWFNFGDEFKQHSEIRPFDEIALEVVSLVENQAEEWWSDKGNITKSSVK